MYIICRRLGVDGEEEESMASWPLMYTLTSTRLILKAMPGCNAASAPTGSPPETYVILVLVVRIKKIFKTLAH